MRKGVRGFTIVEVMVVVSIIGILATVGVLSYLRIQVRVRDDKRLANVTIIHEALERYYLKNGQYPSCDQINTGPAIASLLEIDSEILIAPKATSGTTSSLKCVDDPDPQNEALNDTYVISWTKDANSILDGGFELYYLSEKDSIAAQPIISRYKSKTFAVNQQIPAPVKPTITVNANSTKIIASVAVTTCTTAGYTIEYKINSRQNRGDWMTGTWSTISSLEVDNEQGVLYGFQAIVRCVLGNTTGPNSPMSDTAEAGYIDKPSKISGLISDTNDDYGTTVTIYGWDRTVCPTGTDVLYEYYYTRNSVPALTKDSVGNNYSAGINPEHNFDFSMVIVGQGYTNDIHVRTSCKSEYVNSEWTDYATNSFTVPVSSPGLTFSISREATGISQTYIDSSGNPKTITSKKNDVVVSAHIECDDGLTTEQGDVIAPGVGIYSRVDIWSSKYSFNNIAPDTFGWFSASNNNQWFINDYRYLSSDGNDHPIVNLNITLVNTATPPAGTVSGTWGMRLRPYCMNKVTNVKGYIPDTSNNAIPAVQQKIDFLAPALLP